jgi:hypothetical protein
MADVEAGKRFPFINLEKAIGRAQELFNADPRGNDMSTAGAFAIWTYSEKSSGGHQTLAALRSYGLIAGEEAGRVKLTKLAFDFFRDEREDERGKALAEFALRPPFLRSLWNKWGAHPPADTLARTYLKLERGLNEQSARAVLGIYKDNLAYANLKGDAKLPELEADTGGENGGERTKAKVGDFVQWTSGDADQFPQPRPVEWVAPDGSHLRVVGSPTGIPMNEVTVTGAPKPPPPPAVEPAKQAVGVTPSGNDKFPDNNNISVSIVGKRLQITADVDDKGVEKLEQALAKIKGVLQLLQ